MKATILIIEDNPINMELLVYLIEASGHVVVTATDGQEGLDRMNECTPDLVICDLEMPILNGFEFLERLRRDGAHHDLPVVAVTAASMPGDRTRVMQSGFDGYISKPITPTSFVSEIESFLRSPPPAKADPATD